jgi:two-component system sensor histidine kinase YesM
MLKKVSLGLVPVALIGIILIFYVHSILIDYNNDLLESYGQRVSATLFEITTQSYNISGKVAYDLGLWEFLSANHKTENAERAAINNLDIFENYNYDYAAIDGMEIYSDNPTVRNYDNFHQVDEDIKASDWYQKAISQKASFWIQMDHDDEYGSKYWNLCLVRQIPVVDSEYNAVLVIRLSDNYIKTRLKENEYELAISLDEGIIGFSSITDLCGEKLEDIMPLNMEDKYFKYNGKGNGHFDDSMVYGTVLSPYKSDSVMYICVMNNTVYSNIRKVIRGIILLFVVGMVLPIVIIQIYESILREKELKVTRQEMEYKLLASQINPHFLYNTLESLRMKALTDGNRDIAKAIRMLGRLMRYSLENTGSKSVTLTDSLDYITNYLSLMKLRFGDRIDYSIVIDESLDADKLHIPSLILQPVVENAVLHGLDEKTHEGMISIDVKRCADIEGILLTIKDNGQGMAESVLADLKRNIKHHDDSVKSIGLYNVAHRIELAYGKPYGIDVDSVLGQGTSVYITLPIV